MKYIYYYKTDSNKEPIGRVLATSLDEARQLITTIKQLDVKLVDELFVIKRLDDHENDF
jgi:hypothetical protein